MSNKNSIGKKILALLGILLTFLLLAGCKNYHDIPYDYHKPKKLDDGIQVGNLKEAGFDSIPIIQAVKKLKSGDLGQIHSFIIYKDEKLVLEEYFPGNIYQWEAPAHLGEFVTWNQDMLHSNMSVTKSVTSACIGLAIDKGFIKSVNQSIFDYLPEHQHLKTNGKDKITIEHLLTMTSGMDWVEWGKPYSSIENPIIGIWYTQKDPVSFILEGPLKYKPGTHFSYFGGHQIVLGEILKNATNLTIDEFSEQYLFNPMGIKAVDWAVKFDNGVIEAAGGLKLRPRDMLKFGIAFLDKGRWNNEQIISKEWVNKSIHNYFDETFIKIPGEDSGKVGYSYSWWTKTSTINGQESVIFWAGGWGGQKIIVIPHLKIVVVFTGGNYTSGTKQFAILEDYIYEAMK